MIKHPIISKGRAYPLLFLLLLVLFSAGCGQKAPEPELTRLTIAFPEWVGYGLFYLAKEKGFFREEGIELVFINERLDSARRDAFKQGMLDCEATTLDMLVTKAVQDTPIAAVMEIDHSFGSDGIAAAENIKQLNDLINKKVALSRDDTGEILISYLFQKNGLSLTNVIIVPTRPEEAAKAFLDGKADACVTWEPHLSQALQRPGAHILTSSREHPDIIVDTLNVRKDLIEHDPGLVKRLMRGWFKALKFYREKPNEAGEIIAKYYKITPEQYGKQVAGLKWIDYEHQKTPAKYKEWVEVFNTVTEIKSANGRIPQKPEAQKFLNHSLLEKLYEAGQ
ncbi:MAG: ABC transporter substrate-binding protein [Kiritimatiellia bacterium]|nr:ABC transporter substrate-binding protein [Kiritimatiellia bacterium]